MNDTCDGDSGKAIGMSVDTDSLGDLRVELTAGAPRVASRRHMLLRGIGRGSALLAAAAPIKTLASTPSVTANGQICTISGVQSAAHSQATNLPTCAGLAPAKYASSSSWPTYNGQSINNGTKFSDVFGAGPNTLLWKILSSPQQDSPELHWITAWFNAIKAPAGRVFPYTPNEVVALYNSAQQAAALGFFTGWMETN